MGGGGHARRMALLRLTAEVLGVRFDDLRQREQERRARRLAYLGAVLSVLLQASKSKRQGTAEGSDSSAWRSG